MYCQKCGNPIAEATVACPYCGNIVASANQLVNSQKASGTQGMYNPYFANGPQLPMRWYYFQIYFALFATAFLSVVYGYGITTGTAYGSELQKLAVYKEYPTLKVVDIIVGVVQVSMAAMAIYTRIKLNNYCKSGPKLILLLYIIPAIVSVIYVIACSVIVNNRGVTTQLIYELIAGLLGTVIMVCANKTYYDKRKHLFTE